jgi:hypothetical protein
MRSDIMFDTLQYMDELKRSGMSPDSAEALTKATAKAFNQMMETKEIATKKDLNDLKMDLQAFIIKAVSTTIVILGGLQTILHVYR